MRFRFRTAQKKTKNGKVVNAEISQNEEKLKEPSKYLN